MSVLTRALITPRVRIPGWLAIVPLVMVALALGVEIAVADRILPGVRIGGVDAGGRQVAEVRAILAARADALATEPILVRVGDQTWSGTYAGLGVTVDLDHAVGSAFAVGHEGSPLGRLGAWADALAGGLELAVPRRATDERLAAFLAAIAREVDRAPVEGAVTIGPEGVKILEPVPGMRFPAAAIAAEVLGPGAPGARELGVTLETVQPTIGPDEMLSARLAALAAYTPMTVVAGSERIALAPARLATLVRIEKESAAGRSRLVALIDPVALDRLVVELTAGIERPARDAAYRPGAALLEVVPAQEGMTLLDPDGLRRGLAETLFMSADGERTVVAPVSVTAPSFGTAAAEEMVARMALINEYTTNYPLNWARARNIGLGAARFDGLVLKPGETFSFWGRIGEVSPEGGFVVSGAIAGGRSTWALGGGLCQVSTTLFNAVAGAGYRIDERHPHSYYIERYPVGLDAAVFLPSEDLRWTNDTSGPVYIRSGATETSVSFSIYGVPTGRSVVLSAPLQRNFVLPAPDQPADPLHAAGYVVAGRDAWVTRTVMQDGVVLHRDTFSSHYRPVWGGPVAEPTVPQPQERASDRSAKIATDTDR